jgi:hypothetical protein
LELRSCRSSQLLWPPFGGPIIASEGGSAKQKQKGCGLEETPGYGLHMDLVASAYIHILKKYSTTMYYYVVIKNGNQDGFPLLNWPI